MLTGEGNKGPLSQYLHVHVGSAFQTTALPGLVDLILALAKISGIIRLS
jgi:hypothetical protein